MAESPINRTSAVEVSRAPQVQTVGLGARNHKPDCQCGLCRKIRQNVAIGAAKRAKGQKVRVNLKPREKRFVQEFATPGGPGFKNATKAAELAGYSPDSATFEGMTLLRREQVQSALATAFDKVGLSLEYGTAKLKELMECESTALVKDPKTGEVIEERKLPYWDGRAKGLDQFWRLRGAYPQEQHQDGSGAMVLRVPAPQPGQTVAVAIAVKTSTDPEGGKH